MSLGPALSSCDSIRVVRSSVANATGAVVEMYRIMMMENVAYDKVDTKLSARLLAALGMLLGGTWDLAQLGAAYSYSMYCIRHVELSVSHNRDPNEIGVLLCQESVDMPPNDCGTDGLQLVSAGVGLGYVGSPSAEPSSWPSIDFYHHFQLGDVHQDSHMAAALEAVASVAPEVHASSEAASEIRAQIEALWPADQWNAIVEAHPGHKNFWSEEQLHFRWPGHEQLAITIFNRQCSAISNPKRVWRDPFPVSAGTHDEL